MIQNDKQLSIFDVLGGLNEFCSNHVINTLVERLNEIVKRVENQLPPIAHIKKNYDVWDHVPNLGERLFYWIQFDCEFINMNNQFCGVGTNELYELFEIELLNAEYQGLDISLSVSPQACMISTVKRKR